MKKNDNISQELLLNINKTVLLKIKDLNNNNQAFSTVNVDQLLIYFEFLKSNNEFANLLDSEFLSFFDILNQNYLQNKNQSSNFHLNIVEELINKLNTSPTNEQTKNNIFEMKNEFFGLKSNILSIDSAIFCNKKLVAFLEVDGDHHKDKKRQDGLKTFLYKTCYPTVELYRISLDEVKLIDEKKIVENLANKILNKLSNTV